MTLGHTVAIWGPSPRRRGNHSVGRHGVRSIGAIPAQAGKPQHRCPSPAPSGGHPRAGGETVPWYQWRPLVLGPSPRRRVNHRSSIRARVLPGAIPAQAGKPPSDRCCPGHVGATPRRRGNLNAARYGDLTVRQHKARILQPYMRLATDIRAPVASAHARTCARAKAELSGSSGGAVRTARRPPHSAQGRAVPCE